MRPRFIFWTLGLVIVFLTVACASAPPTQTAPLAAPPVEATAAPLDSATKPAEIPSAQPVATSRGPNLEATDPATVSLASGQLQLVEFFRFT